MQSSTSLPFESWLSDNSSATKMRKAIALTGNFRPLASLLLAQALYHNDLTSVIEDEFLMGWATELCDTGMLRCDPDDERLAQLIKTLFLSGDSKSSRNVYKTIKDNLENPVISAFDPDDCEVGCFLVKGKDDQVAAYLKSKLESRRLDHKDWSLIFHFASNHRHDCMSALEKIRGVPAFENVGLVVFSECLKNEFDSKLCLALLSAAPSTVISGSGAMIAFVLTPILTRYNELIRQEGYKKYPMDDDQIHMLGSLLIWSSKAIDEVDVPHCDFARELLLFLSAFGFMQKADQSVECDASAMSVERLVDFFDCKVIQTMSLGFGFSSQLHLLEPCPLNKCYRAKLFETHELSQEIDSVLHYAVLSSHNVDCNNLIQLQKTMKNLSVSNYCFAIGTSRLIWTFLDQFATDGKHDGTLKRSLELFPVGESEQWFYQLESLISAGRPELEGSSICLSNEVPSMKLDDSLEMASTWLHLFSTVLEDNSQKNNANLVAESIRGLISEHRMVTREQSINRQRELLQDCNQDMNSGTRETINYICLSLEVLWESMTYTLVFSEICRDEFSIFKTHAALLKGLLSKGMSEISSESAEVVIAIESRIDSMLKFIRAVINLKSIM
eukprot:GHVH01003696.1.p1 GENE.GHVH01003696.1~~GHVH01003696.1.p1  ORF type:complete len:615 (+),score=78.37 GHVH01003696.1:521-2365(+)